VKPTACRECKHLRDEGSNYWEKRCGAVPMAYFDALSGQTKPTGFSHIGIINTGNCPKFSALAVAAADA